MGSLYKAGSHSKKKKEPVYLNVYDLHTVNNYFYPIGLGAFHSGVEIYGIEYSFGGHEFSFSGVFEVEPKSIENFRETILLGETSKSPSQIKSIVDALAEEFPGQSYHPLQKNCNSFSQAFTKRVLNIDIPNYINRLAYIGNMFSCFLPLSSLGLPTPSPPSLRGDVNSPLTSSSNYNSKNEYNDKSPLFPGDGYSLQQSPGTNTVASSYGSNNSGILSSNATMMTSTPLILTSSSSDEGGDDESIGSQPNSPSSSSPHLTEQSSDLQERRRKMLEALGKRMSITTTSSEQGIELHQQEGADEQETETNSNRINENQSLI